MSDSLDLYFIDVRTDQNTWRLKPSVENRYNRYNKAQKPKIEHSTRTRMRELRRRARAMHRSCRCPVDRLPPPSATSASRPPCGLHKRRIITTLLDDRICGAHGSNTIHIWKCPPHFLSSGRREQTHCMRERHSSYISEEQVEEAQACRLSALLIIIIREVRLKILCGA